MNITKHVCRVLCLLLVGLVLPAFGEAKKSSETKKADEKFETLQIGTDTYTNVTVIPSTAADTICLMHSGGISTVKIADLPDEAKIRLGFKAVATTNEFAAKFTAEIKKALANVDLGPAEPLRQSLLDTTWRALSGESAALQSVLLTLGCSFALYLIFCYCLKLICDKTGRPAGVLVWFPLLKWIPMFRSAGMSPAWVLALFLPVFNLITVLVWAFKITAARGKHWFVGVLFVLPVTNFFAFLYLAFADAGGKSTKEEKPQRRSTLMTLETA